MQPPVTSVLHSVKSGFEKNTQNNAPLKLVRSLAEALDSNGIIYCHWKSNDRLMEAACGETDLDLLFDPKAQLQVHEILCSIGFIRFETVRYRRYPYIHDYIGIDHETGRLVHVQPHYQLTVGEVRVKSYIIPWAAKILESRVWDKEAGLFRSDPNEEMCTLLFRASLKIHSLPRWMRWRTGSDSKELIGARREAAWLSKRVDAERLAELARTRLGSTSEELIRQITKTGLENHLLRDLAQATTGVARASRRHSRLRQLYLALYNDTSFNLFRLNKMLGVFITPMHRRVAGSGLAIALVGVDGTGKSTQVEQITKRLKTKLDVLTLYMGSGKGPPSLMRLPLVLIKRRRSQQMRKHRKHSVKGDNESTQIQSAGAFRLRKILRTSWLFWWALSLAFEKRAQLRKLTKARDRGYIVICDRFPQTAVMDRNDGPLLSEFLSSRSGLLRALALWELRSYEAARLRGLPDLVVRMRGRPEVIADRRPLMGAAAIGQKQSELLSVDFGVPIVELNAEASPATVSAQILSAAWSRLKDTR